MDPAVLVDIEGLKMDSPDVHSKRFSPDSTVKVDGDFGAELHGDIITRTSQQPIVEGELNTLDEPIMDTVKRDLNALYNKVFYALMPHKNPKFLLLEWDLWGALFFATYVGLLLQQMNHLDPGASQFAQVILIVCLGTAAVTYTHIVMLRTNTSIFQYISVLGYCLAPMALNVTLIFLLYLVNTNSLLIRSMLFVASILLSVGSTHLILKQEDGPLNIPYHLVPLGLYYFTVAGCIFYHTGHSYATATSLSP